MGAKKWALINGLKIKLPTSYLQIIYIKKTTEFGIK